MPRRLRRHAHAATQTEQRQQFCAGENTSLQTQSIQAASLAVSSQSASHISVGRARPDDTDVTVAAAAASGRRVVGLRPRIVNQDTPPAATAPAAEAADSREAEPMQPAADIPREPATACTAANFKERLVAMFLTAEEGPVASRLAKAATVATVSYCLALDPIVRELWKDHATEIKRRCGPSMPKGLIDRQEVYGFALADGLGRPLLPHDAAGGVGQQGDNAVNGANGTGKGERRRKGKLERAREAAREAVRAAKLAASEDPSLLRRVAAAEAAGKAAIAEIMAAPVDLKLPNATVGAKRKRAAAMSADAAAELVVAEKKAALRAALAACEAAIASRDALSARVARADRQAEGALVRWEECDPEDPRCAQYQQHFEQLQDANRQVCAEFEESAHAVREAGHAMRAALYEYELACQKCMLERQTAHSAQLHTALDRACVLLDQRPERTWKGMQQTQTEEQPAGRVLWGRAGRWVPGEHEPWDYVEEGAGESGEEEGVEGGRGRGGDLVDRSHAAVRCGRALGRRGRGGGCLGRGNGSASGGGDAPGQCREIRAVLTVHLPTRAHGRVRRRAAPGGTDLAG